MEMKYRKIQMNDLLTYYLLEKRYFADSIRLSSHALSFLFFRDYSFVCEVDGRIVGICILESINDKNTITFLCVETSFRRLGIARALIKKSISAFQEKNTLNEPIEIMCSCKNVEALSLYQSLGFRIIETVEKAYFDDSDGFILTLKANERQ